MRLRSRFASSPPEPEPLRVSASCVLSTLPPEPGSLANSARPVSVGGGRMPFPLNPLVLVAGWLAACSASSRGGGLCPPPLHPPPVLAVCRFALAAFYSKRMWHFESKPVAIAGLSSKNDTGVAGAKVTRKTKKGTPLFFSSGLRSSRQKTLTTVRGQMMKLSSDRRECPSLRSGGGNNPTPPHLPCCKTL